MKMSWISFCFIYGKDNKLTMFFFITDLLGKMNIGETLNKHIWVTNLFFGFLHNWHFKQRWIVTSHLSSNSRCINYCFKFITVNYYGLYVGSFKINNQLYLVSCLKQLDENRIAYAQKRGPRCFISCWVNLIK